MVKSQFAENAKELSWTFPGGSNLGDEAQLEKEASFTFQSFPRHVPQWAQERCLLLLGRVPGQHLAEALSSDAASKNPPAKKLFTGRRNLSLPQGERRCPLYISYLDPCTCPHPIYAVVQGLRYPRMQHEITG